MNFLSVINDLGNPSLADVLQYNKETKELTIIDPADGTRHTCYVNSMQALVNFSREHLTKFMSAPEENMWAAFTIFMLITGQYTKIIHKYINLPEDKQKNVPIGSYTQWLKITIEAIKIMDALEKITGTWSALYSISGLTEGKTYGPKVESSFAGVINWGDGTFDNIAANDTVQHQYTKDGNYTITLKGGTALEVIDFAGGGGTESEAALNISTTDFELKKTPTA